MRIAAFAILLSLFLLQGCGGTNSASSPGSRTSARSQSWASGSGSHTSVRRPAGYLYVTNNMSDNISAYFIGKLNGALTELPTSPLATEHKPTAITIDPRADLAFVTASDSDVLVYRVDRSSGKLREVSGSPFLIPVDSFPLDVVVSPNGRFIYVGTPGTTIAGFAVTDRSGSLTPTPRSPYRAGDGAESLAIDPSGRFMYVSSTFSGTVSAFRIQPKTGALTEVSGSPFSAGERPNAVAISPSGKFLYVSNKPGAISAFEIHSTDGRLSSVEGSPFAAPAYSHGLAFGLDGRFLYVGNGLTNTIGAYRVDRAAGILTPIKGSPFSEGQGSVCLFADEHALYVANEESRSVSVFDMDPRSGALTAITGSPYKAGAVPCGLALLPL